MHAKDEYSKNETQKKKVKLKIESNLETWKFGMRRTVLVSENDGRSGGRRRGIVTEIRRRRREKMAGIVNDLYTGCWILLVQLNGPPQFKEERGNVNFTFGNLFI